MSNYKFKIVSISTERKINGDSGLFFKELNSGRNFTIRIPSRELGNREYIREKCVEYMVESEYSDMENVVEIGEVL